MRPLAKSSFKSASRNGCRFFLWLLVVLPTLMVASYTITADSPCYVLPRVVFMVTVSLLTVRFLGRKCQAGNNLHICFETGVALLVSYAFLIIIWTNVEWLTTKALATYSYMLEKSWGKGLDQRTVANIVFIVTTAMASSFLVWVFSSAVEHDGPGYSVRFSSVVEVRFIIPFTHHVRYSTMEPLKAPEGPGRNPVIRRPCVRDALDLDLVPQSSDSTLVSTCSTPSTSCLLGSVLDYLTDQNI